MHPNPVHVLPIGAFRKSDRKNVLSLMTDHIHFSAENKDFENE
jgi:hypothetical protein